MSDEMSGGDGRPTTLDTGSDRLLERLVEVHGKPRKDIARELRPRLVDMTLAQLAVYSGLSGDEILRRICALQADEPLRPPTEDEVWRALDAR